MIHFRKIIFSTLLLTTAVQCMESQQNLQEGDSSYIMINGQPVAAKDLRQSQVDSRGNFQQNDSRWQDSHQPKNLQNQQVLNGSCESFSDDTPDESIMNQEKKPNQQQRNDRRQGRNNQQQNQSNFTSTVNNTQQFQEDNSLRFNESSIIRNLTGNNNYNVNLREGENPEFYFGYNSQFPKMLDDFLYLPNSPRSQLIEEAGNEYDALANELRNLSNTQKKQTERMFINRFGRAALEEMKRCQNPKEMHKRAKKLEKEFYDLEGDYDRLDEDYEKLEKRFFKLKGHFERIRSKKNQEINILSQEKETLQQQNNELQVKIVNDAEKERLQAEKIHQQQEQTVTSGRVDRGGKKVINK